MKSTNERYRSGCKARCHASTFDLYSWKNGCRKRYGLVAVDFENGYTRTPKKSYRWYRDFIAGEQTEKPYLEEGQR